MNGRRVGMRVESHGENIRYLIGYEADGNAHSDKYAHAQKLQFEVPSSVGSLASGYLVIHDFPQVSICCGDENQR